MVKYLISITGALVLLSGCASAPPPVPESDVLLPEIDLVMVKENSDEALKLAQESRLDVEVLHSRLSEINNQLLNFSEEMASVSAAKIEELENRMAVLTAEIKNIYFELDSLRKKVKAPKRKKKPAVFSLSSQTFRPGKGEAKALVTPDERKYRQAQSYFNDGKYINAVVAFKRALKIKPEGKYADNCHYWIGESYFNISQFARAITAYKKVFAYAQTDKADNAQMRIAICYAKLGDSEQAVVEFKNLLKKYPHSEFEQEAKRFINQLE